MIYNIIFFILINHSLCLANEIKIAVAANFLTTLEEISSDFNIIYNYKFKISSDSTANLFAKILNNAPFNLFISADKKHPNILEKINLNKITSTTYAFGKIIIIKKNKLKKQIFKYIKKENTLAISNHLLSPYGKSSNIFLENLNIKHSNKITCINITHVFNLIFNNTCNIGITSMSHIKNNTTYSTLIIPTYLYPKIKQKFINLKYNYNMRFKKYIKKNKTLNILKRHGYK